MKTFLTRSRAKTKTFSWYINLNGNLSNSWSKKLLMLVLLPFGMIATLFNKTYSEQNFKYNLSAVLIAKNEGQYIKEWIEYYKILGFDRFYIFDNESTDNLKQRLKEDIEQGLVDYNLIQGKARQIDAYNLALKKSRRESRYLAIIDADEFLFQLDPKDSVLHFLNKMFKANDKVGGIGINWMIFGSSHYEKKPDGLVTQTFLYRSNYNFVHNNLIKTICDPRKVVGVLNPHYVEYKKGYYAQNTLGEFMTGPRTPNDKRMLVRINHYFTKSKEEFLKKRARGMADQQGKRNTSDFNLHDRNEIYDDSMRRYGEMLEKKLKIE